MRKYLLVILSFVFQLNVLFATNYTYRYWIDENTAQTRTSTSNELDFTIDIPTLSCDVHTLFVQVRKDNENWSSPIARPFFVTNKYNAVKTYYWFDDNNSERFEIEKDNGEAIMIDVSFLPDGVHSFHAIMENEDGNTSMIITRSFIKPIICIGFLISQFDK